MNGVSKAYLVNKMKYTIRHLPYKEELKNVRTLDDWVTFQSKMLGYDSHEEYICECDPVYYLHRINVPTLFISSLDDDIFDGEITKLSLDCHLLIIM
jgi:predicted alpha/beta-fold hydrolase